MRTRGALTAAVFAMAALPAAGAQANVQVGTSGWQWGNPLPQGNTLRAMAFAGGGIGYASGDAGTLLKTTDGGSSWIGLRSGTTTDLTEVQAVAPNTVITGAGCVARRSDDGGATFTRIPFTPVESSCDQPLVAFSFVDPTTGFLVLRDGSVFETTDGGQEFTPRTSLPGGVATGGNADATAVTFLSATRGVAALADGRLLLTTDSGVSWTLVSPPGTRISDVQFVTPAVGYAVGDHGLFLRTEDAGVTWTPTALGVDKPLSQIRCADASQCVATTSAGDVLVRIAITPADAPVPVPVTPTTTPTTGTTATTPTTTETTPTTTTPTTTTPVAASLRQAPVAPAPAPTPVPGQVTAALVSPATQAIFAAAYSSPARIAATGADGASVVSDDGGSTFTAVGSRLPGAYSGIVAGGQVRTAYALGAGGALATTTNGGTSWARTNVPTSAALRDVAFPTPQAGYALDATGGLFRTGSAGASWKPLDTGSTARAQTVAATGSAALLIGPRGVRRSTDDGDTFAAVGAKAVRTASLFGKDTAPGGLVLAYGTKALVRTADSGATWKAIPLPRELRARRARMGVRRADFVSAKAGLVLDTRGGVWRTANAGRSWTKLTGVGTTDLQDLAFSSARSGFLVTSGFGDAADSGVVLHTTDAGATWEPQLVLPSRFGTGGVLSPGGGVDYLLGAPSALMASTTGGDSGAASALSLTTRRRTLTKAARITITGKLSPAEGNESVTVSSLPSGASSWRRQTVRTAANGAFTTSWSVKRGTTRFVAQWAGDVRSRGDGSATLSVQVRR